VKLMHESAKIKEAGYFLTLLHAKQNEPDEFPYLLSAFLTAARSVTQYALKEADTTPKSSPPSPGKQWYDQLISSPNYAVLAFLRDERNRDIHVQPVRPRQIVKIEAVMTLFVSGCADYSVNYVDGEGRPVDVTKLAEEAPGPKQEYVPAEPSYRYEFHDWPGGEGVLTLCDMCYRQLQDFVKDGQQSGFLTA
jgi:hypothetical protein